MHAAYAFRCALMLVAYAFRCALMLSANLKREGVDTLFKGFCFKKSVRVRSITKKKV